MPDQPQSGWRPPFWREWLEVFVILVAILTLIIFFEAVQYVASAESNWPLEEPKADHPVGNTFGELVAYRSRIENWVTSLKHIQHFGLDVLADPCCTSSAPDVVVTTDGVVKLWDISGDDNYSSVEIASSRNGHEYVYTYKHLELPVPASSYQTFAETNFIPAGTPISMVRDAFPCGYNHLHYAITQDSESFNPLKEVGPEPDGQDPVISELHFVKHGVEPLSEFGSVNNCPTVSGAVDVIVEVSDKDGAGSSEKAAGSLGIYDLKWRACAAGNPNCGWNDTHTYDAMPVAWSDPTDTTFKDRFSLEEPFRTIKEEWSDVPQGTVVDCEALPVPRTIMFVAKDGAPTWKTQERENGAPKYKNGTYTLSVKALDYAGNDDIYDKTVCVNN